MKVSLVRSRLVATWVAAIALLCGSASAEELSAADFTVYMGVEGTSRAGDIYLESRGTFNVIKVGSTYVPLPEGSGSRNYLIERLGSDYGGVQLRASFDTTNMVIVGDGLVRGDYDNNGLTDLLIQGRSTGDPSILLLGRSGTTTPWKEKVYSGNEVFGEDLSLESAEVSFVALNADGVMNDVRAVWANGNAPTNFQNDDSGTFAFISSNGGGNSEGGDLGDSSLPGPNIPPPIEIATPNGAWTADSASVGATAATFRVDEMGAATYSIPILTAPGISGVAPKISLNYTSQGVNGIVGVGWSIGGLSVIERCRQTQATDGINVGVTYTSSDRFCLDGQRLIVDEDDDYGGDGSLYRKELDDYTRVKSVGGDPVSGPDYFLAYRSDGSVTKYGVDNGSSLKEEGVTLRWSISQFDDSVSQVAEDSERNSIKFHYVADSSGLEQRIARISYAADDSKIVFKYDNSGDPEYPEVRPDPLTRFSAGKRFDIDYRLRAIVSENNGHELRTYELDYDQGTVSNLSQLQSVQECNGNQCFPATTFEWINQGFAAAALPNGTHKGPFIGATPADINGDGVAELLYVDGGIQANLNVLEWDGSRFTDTGVPQNRIEVNRDFLESWSVIDYNNDGADDVIYSFGGGWFLQRGVFGSAVPRFAQSAPVFLGTVEGDEADYAFLDFTGDGLVDLLRFVDGTQLELRRMIDNGPVAHPLALERYTFASIPLTINIQPRNRYTDDEHWPPGTNGALPTVGVTIQDIKPQVADFDGDGNVDLIVRERYEDLSCELNGTNSCTAGPERDRFVIYKTVAEPNGNYEFEYFGRTSVKPANLTGSGAVNLMIADLNGDGLSDILHPSTSGAESNGNALSSTWSYQISDGLALSDPINFMTLHRTNWPEASGNTVKDTVTQARVLDVNTDGYSDFLYLDNRFWRVRYGSPDGFSEPTPLGLRGAEGSGAPEIDKYRTVFFDGNGDGRLDAVVAEHDGAGSEDYVLRGYSSPTTFASGSAENTIHSITNGMGAATNITYRTLSDPTVGDGFYTRATNPKSNAMASATPIFDLNGPIHVVRQVSSSAPTAELESNQSSVLYSYYAARTQSGGRGMLGFHALTTLDLQTLVITDTFYEQVFPLTGRPISTRVRDLTSNVVLSESTTNWHVRSEAGYHQVFADLSVDKTWDLQTGALLSHRTTEMPADEVDDYGNHREIIVSDYGLDDVLLRKNTTSSIFANIDEVAESGRYHPGRLLNTTVSTSRYDNDGPGLGHALTTEQTVSTSFEYKAATGQLEKEVVMSQATDLAENALRLTTTYELDSYGNRTGVSMEGWDGYTSTTRTNGWTYAAPHRRYAQDGIDAYGNVVSTVLITDRDRYGNALKRTEANGNATHSSTDAMGRIYFTGDNTGNGVTTTRRWCNDSDPRDASGSASCPVGAIYYVDIYTVGAPANKKWFDRLGREVRSAQQMFNPSLWSVVLVEYDGLGRVKRQSEPFATALPAVDTTNYWSAMEYDILGRLKQIDHPSSIGEHKTTISYVGLTHVTTVHNPGTSNYDDNGIVVTSEERNYLGEIVRSVDNLNNSVEHSFDELGNVAKTTVTAGGQVLSTKITHDLLGRKTRMDDPDMGVWHYAYNAFGEVITQTNAIDEQQIQRYDELGRMISRHDKVGFTTESYSKWLYDETSGAGFLLREGTGTSLTNAFNKLDRNFEYDAHGRPERITTEIDGEVYVERTTYDAHGRVFQSFDAAGNDAGLEYNYTNQQGVDVGYVVSVNEANDPTRQYYRVTDMDARGNVTGAIKGPTVGGVPTTRQYDRANGLPDEEWASIVNGPDPMHLNYVFDGVGNLKSQTHTWGLGEVHNETYSYDQLHRLKEASGSNGGKQSFTYHHNGNILTKTGIGSASGSNVTGPGAEDGYEYSTDQDTSKPHAVKKAGSRTYEYNGNGSMIIGKRDGALIREIDYTVFNKPSKIDAYWPKDASAYFDYGPNRSRYRRIDNFEKAGREQITHYVGSIERIWRPDGTIQTKRYVMGDVVVTETGLSNTPVREFHYLIKDHLGSLRVIIDEAGEQIQQGFDAFGLRREDASKTTFDPFQLVNHDSRITTRGFTGHEMVDEIGLIHMNGRMYDPFIGRFISADSIVQAPSASQSYNRYTYVFNNPLSYTDPSGNISIKQLAIVAIGAVVTYATAGTASGLFAGAGTSLTTGQAAIVGAISGAAGGFTTGILATGSVSGAFRNAAFGALGGGAFGAIGASGYQYGTKILAHAITGGVLSELQGGKFGHGFLSAGATKALNVNRIVGIDPGKDLERIFVAALIGGSVSEITGGKFANGAFSASLGQALNGNEDIRRERAQSRAEAEEIGATLIEFLNGIEGDSRSARAKLAALDDFLNPGTDTFLSDRIVSVMAMDTLDFELAVDIARLEVNTIFAKGMLNIIPGLQPIDEVSTGLAILDTVKGVPPLGIAHSVYSTSQSIDRVVGFSQSISEKTQSALHMRIRFLVELQDVCGSDFQCGND